MSEYSHYIRKDANGIVVHGYTTGFETPIEGDLLLTGQDGRHFQIKLINERGQFIYKLVNGSMVARSQTELDVEWNSRPATPKTPEQKKMDKLTVDNEQLNLQIIELFEQLVEKGVL